MKYNEITLKEIKNYLHVDFNDDDELLNIIMRSARGYIETITRMKSEDWEEIPDELTQVFFYLVSIYYEQRSPIMGSSIDNKDILKIISMLLYPHDMGGMF